MKHDEICWILVDREDLLDVFLAEYMPKHSSQIPPESALLGVKIAVGYRCTQYQPEFAYPSLIVIPDSSANETLSWLRTFAGEVFPLSQYARVLLLSEWHQYDKLHDSLDFGEPRSYRWASMIVGEALCQIEGEASLQNLPLSRFAGCFTTPIARASIIWKNRDTTLACTDRLRQLENDRRFSRRSVGVEQLHPIWSIANSNIHSHHSPDEAVNFVLEAANEYFKINNQKSNELSSSILTNEFCELKSDSVEERVSAFNRLSSHILSRTQSGIDITQSAIANVVLAAAAFLVGRSTSHIFLLQRVQRLAPTAAAWFGVIAALAGPQSWDKAWLRTAKGAERLLRPEFSWLNMSNSDICWMEFAWLARNFDRSDVFTDLPKMLPRTLNIEIIPGATCQFRIGNDSVESESKQVQIPSARELVLSDAVGQFLALAQKFENIIERLSPNSREQLQSIMNSNDAINIGKNQRAKKPRKSPNDK